MLLGLNNLYFPVCTAARGDPVCELLTMERGRGYLWFPGPLCSFAFCNLDIDIQGDLGGWLSFLHPSGFFWVFKLLCAIEPTYSETPCTVWYEWNANANAKAKPLKLGVLFLIAASVTNMMWHPSEFYGKDRTGCRISTVIAVQERKEQASRRDTISTAPWQRGLCQIPKFTSLSTCPAQCLPVYRDEKQPSQPSLSPSPQIQQPIWHTKQDTDKTEKLRS